MGTGTSSAMARRRSKTRTSLFKGKRDVEQLTSVGYIICFLGLLLLMVFWRFIQKKYEVNEFFFPLKLIHRGKTEKGMKCLCFIISSVPGAADVSYAAQNYSTKYKYSGMVIARHHNMTVPGPASWGQHGTEQVNVESIWWFAPYTPECCCCLLFPSACLCCAVLEPKNHGKLQSRLTTRKINTFGKLFSEHLQNFVHAQFHALHGMFSAFGAPKFGSTYAALWHDLAFIRSTNYFAVSKPFPHVRLWNHCPPRNLDEFLPML
jgi:hypothetical protein